MVLFRYHFGNLSIDSTYKNQLEYVNRFSHFKLNNGESAIIHAREELYRSDKYKHLFREYDVAALQSSMLWAAVANTAPMSC